MEQQGKVLHEDRLVRVSEIVGDKKANIKGLVPVCEASWWAGVRRGIYPQPVRLGPKVTCWRLSDVLSIVKNGPLKPEPESIAA